MKKAFFILGLLGIFCALISHASPAFAQTPAKKNGPITSPADLSLIDVGIVTEILAPDLIKLKNKKTYRLDQVRIPVVYSNTAIDYLTETILNKNIGIYGNNKSPDSLHDTYGNGLGHVLLEDATWLQAEMVKKGIAWAYSTSTNNILTIPLYKIEAEARDHAIGLWKNPEYTIKDGTSIGNFINSFQVFEGRIDRVKKTPSQGYIIYFKPVDKKTLPFRLFIDSTSAKKFDRLRMNSLNPLRWVGATMRVRGWIERDEKGPFIDLTHPQQYEFIAKQGK